MVVIPGYRHKHLRWVEEYAQRHFTDPGVSLEDAFHDLDVRTLRRSLAHCRTNWRTILKETALSSGRGAPREHGVQDRYVGPARWLQLDLRVVKVFRGRYSGTPSEYRRGKKGPARASVRPAPSTIGPPLDVDCGNGWGAVLSREMSEALERINDRRELEGQPRDDRLFHRWEETSLEQENPRRLRHEAARWKEVALDRKKSGEVAA
jgi:hypothetical protein